MEFRDGDQEWIIEGSPSYGLPTASDLEVYVVLMELTRLQGFPSQVTFTQHDLLVRLSRSPNGRNYRRLNDSLNRLVGVSISTKKELSATQVRETWPVRRFGLVDDFELADGRKISSKPNARHRSWIRWGAEFQRNLRAGHIHRLDVDLFLSLKSAVSQALYRYLNAKQHDGVPTYRIGLKRLAWEHLGLSRNYYPSQIKCKLKVAHRELLEVGFLSAIQYASGETDEEVIYYWRGGSIQAKVVN